MHHKEFKSMDSVIIFKNENCFNKYICISENSVRSYTATRSFLIGEPDSWLTSRTFQELFEDDFLFSRISQFLSNEKWKGTVIHR